VVLDREKFRELVESRENDQDIMLADLSLFNDDVFEQIVMEYICYLVTTDYCELG
jgi:hypothetical protein